MTSAIDPLWSGPLKKAAKSKGKGAPTSPQLATLATIVPVTSDQHITFSSPFTVMEASISSHRPAYFSQETAAAQHTGHSVLIARFLRMLSILLEQLQSMRDANNRAEFAGLANHASELEAETNALEFEMEELCLAAFSRPLTSYQLAFVVMVFRSLASLERVGDYAFQVARDLEKVAPRIRSATLQDVLPFVQLLEQMVEQLAYAFAERDLAAARLVKQLDYEQVDALHDQMQRASLTRLLERPEDCEVALTAGHIARNLERLGDHLVSVAERLEWLICQTATDAQTVRDDGQSTDSQR